MVSAIPFKPDRFRSAAQYYVSGRPDYAPRLIRKVAKRCALGRDHGVLDLGCGPGQLAIALAPFAGRTVAMDPEPEMLRIAAARATAVGVDVRFIQGSSYDLEPGLGEFRLVVIGRAFHWMDRLDTLRRFDAMIDPAGAVALFDVSHLDVPENAWTTDYKAIVERYAEGDADRVMRKSSGWPAHEAVLLDSPFNVLERISVIERCRVTVDQLVDRALSMSSTAHTRIGARADELANEIRAAMSAASTDGSIGEVLKSRALIAHRPGAAQ
jgi:SAM-dependent methyltransferase